MKPDHIRFRLFLSQWGHRLYSLLALLAAFSPTAQPGDSAAPTITIISTRTRYDSNLFEVVIELTGGEQVNAYQIEIVHTGTGTIHVSDTFVGRPPHTILIPRCGISSGEYRFTVTLLDRSQTSLAAASAIHTYTEAGLAGFIYTYPAVTGVMIVALVIGLGIGFVYLRRRINSNRPQVHGEPEDSR